MVDLQQAIANDSYIQIKKLLDSGANPSQIIENEDSENDESLLFYALHKKCTFETLKLLVESMENFDEVDSQGVSLLDEAVILGNREFITYLLDEKKMDLNSTKRKSGMTVLIQAACYGNIDLVQYLISKGADIKAKDKFGMDAMGYARKLQQKKMLKFLEDLI
jgi:ankyrin repeat protein